VRDKPLCAGISKPAAEIVSAPVRSPYAGKGRGARQAVAFYGRGRCSVCGRILSVDSDGRMRRHEAQAGQPARGGAS
jgi:hypothetical protein